MSEILRPTTAYAFPNGMMMVFDQYGQQMPEFQGRTVECLPMLRAVSAITVQGATWDGSRDDPIVRSGTTYDPP